MILKNRDYHEKSISHRADLGEILRLIGVEEKFFLIWNHLEPNPRFQLASPNVCSLVLWIVWWLFAHLVTTLQPARLFCSR
ncbi:hypothetical protein CMK12_06610 [Candidatus Poribacteria bacterium]|jgi:hypothetical protein|nr:hypothetical protein [Candidatus Poribacteria bacterium]